jgi:raffinose/stachyose/melibiose transport system permease protein
MKRPAWVFWVFLAPALLAFTLVQIIPALRGFYFSVTDWDGVSSRLSFAGLANYAGLVRDQQFLRSFAFTSLFTFSAVITINLAGFLLALLVTQKFRAATILRSVFFMPNLIGGILLGFAWQFIFVQVFDSLSKKFGILWMAGWLSNQVTGFLGLLIVITWQLSGYMMIIYIAQLQNIPDSLLEAAEVDGANPPQKLRHIILPLMAPAFTIGLFLSISHAFKLYDMNVALTNGGPSDSTQMLSLNIYQTAFIEGRFGLAQSKAVMFLIVITVVSLIQLKISKSREIEQ